MVEKQMDDYYCPMCSPRKYFGEIEIHAARHMREAHNRKGGYTKRVVGENQLKKELSQTVLIFDKKEPEAPKDPPPPINATAIS